MAQIDALFNLMFSEKASDLHLSSGNPPILRINGELTRVDVPPLHDEQLKMMLYEIAPDTRSKPSRKPRTLTSVTRSAASRAFAPISSPEKRHRRCLPADPQHGALVRGL